MAIGSWAVGINAAIAMTDKPPRIKLPGLNLMPGELFGGLLFGTLDEKGSYVRCCPAERRRSPCGVEPSSVFSSISSISRSNLDLSGIGEYYLVQGVRVVILEIQ